jgi:DNA-binding XRE family transcriptional regulator
VKVTNSIGWETRWLREVVAFCCRELDYPARNIRAAHFSQCHNGDYRGWASYDAHKIRVKINPLNAYPVRSVPHRGLPPVGQADAVEVLVRVTAHEIAHLDRYDRFVKAHKERGGRDTRLEEDTERLARGVLKAFRERRGELLAGWGEAGPGPVPPGVVHRWECKRCGRDWESARAPSDPKRRSCPKCFKGWKEAEAAGEFLAYTRARRGEPVVNSSRPEPAAEPARPEPAPVVNSTRPKEEVRATPAFAPRLKELCREKGVTPYRLAQLTGLSKQGVLNLELPGADPKLSTLYRLAAALGVDVRDLLPRKKGSQPK